MSSELGDSVVPIYEFTWTDGDRTWSRRTDGDGMPTPQPYRSDEGEDLSWSYTFETLELLGELDPDCEVKLVGWRS